MHFPAESHTRCPGPPPKRTKIHKTLFSSSFLNRQVQTDQQFVIAYESERSVGSRSHTALVCQNLFKLCLQIQILIILPDLILQVLIRENSSTGCKICRSIYLTISAQKPLDNKCRNYDYGRNDDQKPGLSPYIRIGL